LGGIARINFSRQDTFRSSQLVYLDLMRLRTVGGCRKALYESRHGQIVLPHHVKETILEAFFAAALEKNNGRAAAVILVSVIVEAKGQS
jgi:hypothetical protein